MERITIRFKTFAAVFLLLTFFDSSPSLAAREARGAAAKQPAENLRRVALVIGNSDYAASPLKNPANDAQAMAATLRRLGFAVEELTDLGFGPMNEAVERFGAELRKGGVGLFYYAGHGMQVNGVNYLIPVDTEVNDENEVRYKAVDAGLVLSKMEQARNHLNVVILDACRDNPFARAFRSTSRGLANMEAPAGTFIAYATAPGKTAADGSGKNGLYTSELVKVLGTPGLKLEDVFKLTLKAVREKSKGKQTPWVASNLENDFWFAPASAASDPVGKAAIAQTPPGLSDSDENAAEVEADAPRAEQLHALEMVEVQGGCFQMGDFRGENKPIYLLGSSEHPVHKVCLNDFSIGKYPVTQGEWRTVMGNNPSYSINCGDDCPVENVSWEDVQDFIDKLNDLTKMKYRLPTEAEWEYACKSRGNNERYCGGNELDELGWYDGNSVGKQKAKESKLWPPNWFEKKDVSYIKPVGQKQPNGLGIYDMSGNVWQWVQDWYDRKYYKTSPLKNPKGPASGSSRVCRGGSWSDAASDARASSRVGKEPGVRSPNLGFRLAAPAR